jgi:hypothetical protein
MFVENYKMLTLTQDRDQWQALVNTAMNLHVSKKSREFLD